MPVRGAKSLRNLVPVVTKYQDPSTSKYSRFLTSRVLPSDVRGSKHSAREGPNGSDHPGGRIMHVGPGGASWEFPKIRGACWEFLQ